MMPRARGRPGARWPWLFLAVMVIIVVFVVLWATGIIF
jgi:hypothetical protein